MDVLVTGAARLGIHLSPKQIDQFTVYYRELINWNRSFNLTAIIACREVQVKHFLDSLTVTLAPGELNQLLDIGTGAGFPGIPLKIWKPELDLTLLEATGKKTAFLRHIVATLGLEVAVINGRAEDLAHDPVYRERFERVAARGVAPMASLVELALPFCRVGGMFIAPKKGDLIDEMNASRRAVKELGGELKETVKVDLPEFDHVRWLTIVNKVAPTPARYPRRAGIPAKSPL